MLNDLTGFKHIYMPVAIRTYAVALMVLLQL